MTTLATSPHDPVNRAILEVSEDRIRGFVRNPIGEIARLSGFDTSTVIEQIAAMLRAGTVRRVRQTLQATNLAQGALVAWLMSLQNQWFLPLLVLDTVPKFVQLIKLVQQQVGHGHERVRAPRLVLDGAEREATLALIGEKLAARPRLQA